MSKRFINVCLTLCFIFASALSATTQTKDPLVLGAERMDEIVRLLNGKRVGLIVNQTSILEHQDQQHVLDALLDNGIEVVKVFAPEHGFRG